MGIVLLDHMTESSILMCLGNEQSNWGTIAPQTCMVESSIHVRLKQVLRAQNVGQGLRHLAKGARVINISHVEKYLNARVVIIHIKLGKRKRERKRERDGWGWIELALFNLWARRPNGTPNYEMVGDGLRMGLDGVSAELGYLLS
ncbi:Hypothetical predicted protein [Prunus dulcis]|uniref:Uncharacterized protein n=1 Tax=Prunus dulcis TaxID=3755 RepID=A0A5E4FJA2_PRUDU|nr:Hypothetical predicted protein [Prunus dulcis]